MADFAVGVLPRNLEFASPSARRINWVGGIVAAFVVVTAILTRYTGMAARD
jgi:uncharacterized membrane protein YdcZ (DUF606 family)